MTPQDETYLKKLAEDIADQVICKVKKEAGAHTLNMPSVNYPTAFLLEALINELNKRRN